MTDDSSAKKHHPWTWVGVVAWVLLIGLVGIRMYATSRIPATAREQVVELERTRVSLPRDWHQPAAIPPAEVVAFHKSFASQMEVLRKKHHRLLFGDDRTTAPGLFSNFVTNSVTDEEQTSLPLLLQELQPLIEETSRAVRLPGYTLDLDISGGLSFLEFQSFAKLMPIMADEQAHRGDCHTAMETAALPLQMVARPEQSHLITHLIAVAIANISTRALHELAEQCTDPVALQRGLELLNQHKPRVFPHEIKHWYNDEELVALRYAAAYGYPVDISPQSKAGYIRQRYQLYSRDYYQWIIDNFPFDDPKVTSAKRNIDVIDKGHRHNVRSISYWMSDDAPKIRKALAQIATGLNSAVLYHVMIMWPHYEEAFNRAYVALARYDLARLTFAQRLAKVDPGTTITTYLSPIPDDPFTSAPFPYSNTLGQYYSVGPDGKDDGAHIKYDPDTDTKSAGDIWMESR